MKKKLFLILIIFIIGCTSKESVKDLENNKTIQQIKKNCLKSTFLNKKDFIIFECDKNISYFQKLKKFAKKMDKYSASKKDFFKFLDINKYSYKLYFKNNKLNKIILDIKWQDKNISLKLNKNVLNNLKTNNDFNISNQTTYQKVMKIFEIERIFKKY